MHAVTVMTRRGMSAQEISVHLKLTKRTVLRYRAKNRTSTPPGWKRESDRRAQAALDLARQGMSSADIGARLGVAKRTVNRYRAGAR